MVSGLGHPSSPTRINTCFSCNKSVIANVQQAVTWTGCYSPCNMRIANLLVNCSGRLGIRPLGVRSTRAPSFTFARKPMISGLSSCTTCHVSVASRFRHSGVSGSKGCCGGKQFWCNHQAHLICIATCIPYNKISWPLTCRQDRRWQHLHSTQALCD